MDTAEYLKDCSAAKLAKICLPITALYTLQKVRYEIFYPMLNILIKFNHNQLNKQMKGIFILVITLFTLFLYILSVVSGDERGSIISIFFYTLSSLQFLKRNEVINLDL